MKRLWFSVLALLALGVTAPVAAQTTGGSDPSVWYGEINGGATVVEKAGGAIGGEVGRRWRGLDVLAEGVWMSNASDRQQREGITLLKLFLEETQSGAVEASIKVPVFYVGGGVRYVMHRGERYQPYGIVTFGLASSNRNSTFTVGGTDVTDTLGDYGIALGEDLSGTVNSAAGSGGVGVLIGSGQWYLDVGARMFNMGGGVSRVNGGRLVVGAGYRY
jgi:hypothetical protein